MSSDENYTFSLSTDNLNILNSCRMLHTEHDNTENEDLQGNGKDKDNKFIKMKVVSQDNSEVQFKVQKMADKIPEA